jgi:hypothetical protein
MSQDQDQNDNLFNFNSQQPEQPPSSNDQTIFSGGAQAYETPSSVPANEPVFSPPPAFTPPPPAYTPPPPSTQQPSKMNRTWLIVIIVLVVLCCCCLALGAFGWFFGDTIMQNIGIN